jgi:hydroxysqualene synthase
VSCLSRTPTLRLKADTTDDIVTVHLHARCRSPPHDRSGGGKADTTYDARVQIKMHPVPHRSEPLARAYAACEALARSHYENFPVASRLLPPSMRPHVAAVYAFARVADDIADEGTAPTADRLIELNAWQRRLHAAVTVGRPADAPHAHEDLIVVALAHSIRSLDLPIALFDDLLSAFAQDTMTTRYGSWDEVLDYCRRSANPVGRLVLRIAGYRDDALDRSADALCTALQLTNFWQDVGRDWRAGRLYVPGDVAAACGAREAELNGPSLTAPWMAALDRCVAETRRHFDAGREVCDAVRGRLRYELRFTWLGGARMLDRVRHTGAALLTDRPTLGARDLPVILWRAARWRWQDR